MVEGSRRQSHSPDAPDHTIALNFSKMCFRAPHLLLEQILGWISDQFVQASLICISTIYKPE